MLNRRHRMSRPHFNLRDKHSKKETPIFLYYKYDPEKPRLKYSIKQTCLPKYWDKNAHRVKVSLNYPKHLKLNQRLNKIENEAIRLVETFDDISHEKLKLELDYFLRFKRRPEPRKAPSFFSFLEQWIKEQEGKMNYRSIQKWNAVINHLKEYAKTTDKGVVDYEDIDLVFKEDFAYWLNKKRKLSQNTVAKVIKNVKQLMKKAHDHKFVDDNGLKVRYHSNDIINDSRFKTEEIATTRHALTFQELNQLFNSDLSDHPRFDKVRDNFCFMAFSGLRISDLYSVSKENIISDDDGNEYIHLFTFKGRSTKRDNEIFIPFRPELKRIMEKYDYELPRISDQKMNDYIKDVGEHVKLNRSVMVKDSKKDSTPKSLPIHKLLSNHVGRYTYISMMINEFGVAPQDLQRITGQSLPILMKYVRGDKRKAVARAAKQAEIEISKKRMKVIK